MSSSKDTDAPGEESRRPTPPPRLASVLSNTSSTGSQTGSQRDTTLGGVQKAKFAPIVNARRAKKEPGDADASSSDKQSEPIPREQRGAARGRGRGRGASSLGNGTGGHGGRGLLSTDRRGASNAPAVISGPFSLGPSSAAKSGAAAVSVGFAGGPRSGASSRGSFASGRSTGSRSFNASSITIADDSEIVDLEQIMGVEALSLGEEYCPVNVTAGTGADSSTPIELEEDVSALLESEENILLLQLPVKIPELLGAKEASVGEDGTLQESWEWPAEGTEGQFGKLCVHQSGRVSLEINGIRYFISAGLDSNAGTGAGGGAMSIVAIDPDYEQSFELGQVKNTLLASLDFESLLTLVNKE